MQSNVSQLVEIGSEYHWKKKTKTPTFNKHVLAICVPSIHKQIHVFTFFFCLSDIALTFAPVHFATYNVADLGFKAYSKLL